MKCLTATILAIDFAQRIPARRRYTSAFIYQKYSFVLLVISVI